jgi:hypothetical protein
MGVTLALLTGLLVVVMAVALGVSGHRKTDATLLALSTSFKFD